MCIHQKPPAACKIEHNFRKKEDYEKIPATKPARQNDLCAFNRGGKKSYLVRGKVFPARRNNPRIKAAETPMRQGRPKPPSGPSKTKSRGWGDFNGKAGV